MFSTVGHRFKLNRMIYMTIRRSSCLPEYKPYSEEEFNKLETFFRKHRRIAVLTGAGVSTESGMPDFNSGVMTSCDLKSLEPEGSFDYKDVLLRKTHWAKDFFMWQKYSECLPNTVHVLLCQWEKAGKVSNIITQNVDNLHIKAGSRNVIELHGSLHRVICMKCKNIVSREEFQKILSQMNPNINNTDQSACNMENIKAKILDFKVPFCQKCEEKDGILKPDVIFKYDPIPEKQKRDVLTVIKQADALLVLGSSLYCPYSHKIVTRANEENKDVAIITIGKIKQEFQFGLLISANCSDILQNIELAIFLVKTRQ